MGYDSRLVRATSGDLASKKKLASLVMDRLSGRIGMSENGVLSILGVVRRCGLLLSGRI